jgi:hypothetical protein
MTPSSPEGFAASASALPRSALRRSILSCCTTLANTAAIATQAAESGMPNESARYLLDTMRDLAPEFERLQRHLAATPDTEP